MIIDEASLDAAQAQPARHADDRLGRDGRRLLSVCVVFAPSASWLRPEGTALCPRCGIDAVIGDRSGCPAGRPDFLQAMHARWF
ncbi:cytoplasmic protein [Methylobacterium nodulans]|uniref:cytoplasmic protein n=1 Tax=Methylobacterium nodulans TaxID=114616 RepID=UPI001FCBCF60|nr:cytoplasmic protein [Methylobacterium nodulans]